MKEALIFALVVGVGFELWKQDWFVLVKGPTGKWTLQGIHNRMVRQ